MTAVRRATSCGALLSVIAFTLTLLCLTHAVVADDGSLSALDIYTDACASCHGIDGRGASEGTRIDVPLPDFSDCNFITREGDGNWRYLLAHGGDGLGLSTQMPGFGDVLSEPQIQSVLDYIRAFCSDPRWPRGDLNFRRPIFTAKAFPEDEALLNQEFTKGRNGTREWSTELSLERRIGPRGQLEVAVPLAMHDVSGGASTGGIGDMTLAYKHVLYADLPSRTVVAAGLDLVLPTGDRHRGLGAGTVSFEPSLLGGKEWRGIVLQGQIAGVAPVDERRADRAVQYRVALSYPFSDLRRAWVPTVEVEVLQNVTARQHHVFVTPEIYKGLTKRGHIALAVGAQIPVAGDADPFDVRVVGFLLWDYLDGGLWW